MFGLADPKRLALVRIAAGVRSCRGNTITVRLLW